MQNWVSPNAYRTYRQPAIDAVAWVGALGLFGALDLLRGASFSMWWLPVLAACAAAAQLVLNFPLYKGYRDDHSVEGIALSLSTATVVLAMVFGLSLLFRSGVPPEVLVLSALGAVLLILAPRCLRWARQRGVEKQRSTQARKWPLEPALALAQELEARVGAHPAVLHCAYAGSVRRGQSEVGDVEIVVATGIPTKSSRRSSPYLRSRKRSAPAKRPARSRSGSDGASKAFASIFASYRFASSDTRWSISPARRRTPTRFVGGVF